MSNSTIISRSWFMQTWHRVNEIKPHHWDGFFGMEESDWEQAGVVMTDDVETVIKKVDDWLDIAGNTGYGLFCFTCETDFQRWSKAAEHSKLSPTHLVKCKALTKNAQWELVIA